MSEMPSDVNIATDPLFVYGMVALFVGALVLALLFVRPRRGLGAVKRSDVPDGASSSAPWMPGGDVFGREPQPGPEAPPAAAGPWLPENDPWQPAADPWPAASDPWQPAPPAVRPPAGSQPAAHDPWSTGATGQPGPQPRWDKP